LFGEFSIASRQRAWADPFEDGGTGVPDSINSLGQVVAKRNAVLQPNTTGAMGSRRTS